MGAAVGLNLSPAALGRLRPAYLKLLDDGTARRVVEMARTLTNHVLVGIARGPDGKWVGEEDRTRGTPAYAAEVARFAAWVEEKNKPAR